MTENRMSPRVSVVTIFFNAAPFLAEAIESVLAQAVDAFELLLVDDGSTDASTDIAKAYAERHPAQVRYLDHPDHANRGMSAARNLGVENALGEFVAFIDADDRWRAHKLGDQLAIFERFPEVDAVCGAVNYWRSWEGGSDRIFRTGHVQNRPVPPPEAALALYPLGSANAPCPSDLMLRRSAIEAVGGFEESFTGALQMYEDQAFLAKFYLERTIYFADRIWLDYRQHDQSCVAEVSRQGRYEEVRGHFLDWFEAYLDRSASPHAAEVRAALDRARLGRPTLRTHLIRALKMVWA
jgi:glycosyltransferase involved in cell wall biosynthesis